MASHPKHAIKRYYCKLCGGELFGGPRLIGVCVDCVLKSKDSVRNIPAPQYRVVRHGRSP